MSATVADAPPLLEPPATGPVAPIAPGAACDARLADVAGRAVLAFSVVLAAVEVGRVAVLNGAGDLAVALVATALFLPLHLWHLRFGVRGARPPHAGWTLAAVALVNGAALVVIGPAWTPMLATVATSALIVLPPPWALAALAACVGAPVAANAVDHDLTAALGDNVIYLMVVVLFRATILFTMVWLVAAAAELAASRQRMAQDAADRESGRIEATMRRSLERSLDRLAAQARDARAAVLAGDPGRAGRALEGLRASAVIAGDELRRVVRGARWAPPAPAPEDRASGRAPVARGLTRLGARGAFVAVHAVVLGFVLSASLGAYGPSPADPLYVVVAWVAMVALQLSSSVAVARGGRPRWPLAHVLGAVAITVTGVALYGQGWRDPGWVAGAIIAVSTRGRLRVVALLTLLGGLAVYDTTLTHQYMPDASTATIAWYFFYTATISVMGTAALAGCARLIDLLGRLDEARDLHVAATVERERRRSWADLHDVLGHTMTAIALRADLARRVLAGDPARAATELEDLVGLASAQADELRAVARGDRSLRFAIEAASAVRLLRQAGVQVLCELDVDHLDDRGDAVLGSAAREGSTNILRHAQARRCVMRARRDGDRVVFELRNDGVLAAPGSGTGLRGLAERARGCHGSLVAGPEDDGWFALRVSVPLRGSA